MNVLNVKNIAKNYGGLDVLHDVTFNLKAGEKVALIGPNGAGKTTLINILSGMIPASHGCIFFLDDDITRLPPHQRVSRGLSRSFQISSLFPGLSLFENTLLALCGVQRMRYQMLRSFVGYDENNRIAGQLLERISLSNKKDMLVRELSHGEKRRLEIGLTLSSRPKVLLLDEPNAGLDGAETADLISLIEDLPADTATLVVAHDVDFIYRLCDRVLVLYYGKIIADGTCEEIQCDQKVCNIYLGTEAKDAELV